MDHGEGRRLTRRRSRSRFDEARLLRPGQQAGSIAKMSSAASNCNRLWLFIKELTEDESLYTKILSHFGINQSNPERWDESSIGSAWSEASFGSLTLTKVSTKGNV